jgi:uncharacterized protein
MRPGRPPRSLALPAPRPAEGPTIVCVESPTAPMGAESEDVPLAEGGVEPAYLADFLAWREARLRRLQGPEGWLSLVGLDWLLEGENPVGSDPSCRVRLPAGKAPARAGSIAVAGGRAVFRAEPGSGVVYGDRAVTEVGLRDDSNGEPTVLRVGTVGFHIIKREGRLAVRVRDGDSPALRAGAVRIPMFALDPRWRIEGRFEAYDPPRSLVAPNVLGTGETFLVPGALRFAVDGVGHRLEAFREPNVRDLFVVFGDRTNGTETFGGGRYLYAAPRRKDGKVVVDFNRAYNPPCVFTPYATCALPRPENRLPIRIEAGEKRYEPL